MINYNILIVEDSNVINQTIYYLLSENKSYNLDQALSFKEASNLLKNNQYDFILLDLNLPDAYGEALVDNIKKLTTAKIIVLTGEIDINIRETLFKKGILDYLLKNNNLAPAIRGIQATIESTEQNSTSNILLLSGYSLDSQQLQTILKTRNYNVEIVFTQEDGLKLLQNKEINTIVIDIEKEKTKSLEFLSEIKKIDKFFNLPVIVIAKTNNPEIIRDALKMGAYDFIKKPFNIEEFTLKVDLAIKTNRNYLESISSQKMLNEYKEAVDESSYVSKTNLKGIITYVNDIFCELSGYTKEELLGAPHNILRHPDMPSAIFKDMWQTIKSKKVWKGTIKNRKKNGEAYYVKSLIKPILDVSGNIIEYIAIRTDVTELEIYKKNLEKNLAITNNNLAYLKQYEKAMDEFIAVIKTDTNNIITYANDNFSKISGYSKEELLGKHCKELRSQKHIDKRDCENISKELEKEKAISILFENISKNKKTYYVDTKIYPLHDKNHSTQEHLHLMYDVTEIIKIHEELENTQKDIIYKMGEIGETRSKETGNHVKRVAQYSKLLAQLAGMDEKDINLLYLASPMHDIGKVSIPDSILNKPGRLTDEEFEIMKTHAEVGYHVLKESNRPILKAAAIVAYTHHEKWDGTGYPNGLKGEDIHIFGRITAIADVFDALGSDRVYKKGWKLEKILNLFKQERSKHFDPKLMNLFLDNLDKFLEIRETLKDSTSL